MRKLYEIHTAVMKDYGGKLLRLPLDYFLFDELVEFSSENCPNNYLPTQFGKLLNQRTYLRGRS